jgi:hypothetical protein
LGPEAAVGDGWAIVFLPYDWNLNRVEGWDLRLWVGVFLRGWFFSAVSVA